MVVLCPAVHWAFLCALLQGATFVACLYICATHRRAGGRAPDRDDPRVVKDRFLRVGIASLIAPVFTLAAALLPGAQDSCALDGVPIARLFGLWTPSFVQAALLPLVLTMVLFLGPLVMAWIDRDDSVGSMLDRLRAALEWSEYQRHLKLRNLVIGPLAEEWVFRVCMCPLLFGAGLSDVAIVFGSAFVFGLAHIHHVFDADVSWAVVAVQFTYTSLFGAYSSYLFLRTGHLVGPLLAHSFCNSQGLPNFGGVPGHTHARTLSAAFIVGRASFALLVFLDAIYRPALFGSVFWDEKL